MSAVKKTAKTGLYIFSLLVLLLVGGAVYLYINLDSIAKQITEKVASDALGVPVSVGSMNISLEKKKIIITDVRIANPAGYKKPNAITVKRIEVAGESFSKELLTFSRIMVDGTNVNLEVGNKGTNLGDLKNNIGSKSPAKTSKPSKGGNIKVIVKKFSLTAAQLNPSITLLGGDLAQVTVPDINLRGIGQKENGILAQDAIAQIMEAVLQKFNNSAGSAGFLKGLPVDAIKENINKNINKKVDDLKGNLQDGLKSMFK